MLKDPPVFHVLVQINFTSIPTLKDNIDRIHEEFRQQGFADKKQEVHQGVSIHSPEPNQNVKIEHLNKISWHFSNFERDSGFMLCDEFLVFHTTNYQNFEDFLSKFNIGLKALIKTAGIFYTTQIGLRYLDALLIKHNESLEDYLIRDVIGIANSPLKDDGFLTQHSMFESVLQSSESNKTCVSRVVIAKVQDSPPIMPQDLIPLVQKLELKDIFQKMTGLMALIDIDCIKAQIREKPDSNNINAYIEDLHSHAATVFKSLITSARFDLWKA